MEQIKGEILKSQFKPAPLALTFGNFDGVHRGHLSLINSLKDKAKEKNLKTGLFTLNPHPRAVLKADHFLPLQAELDREKRLKTLGIDYLFIQNFNSDFANLKPEDFLRQYIVKGIQPKLLLFGYDFRFGLGGRGDFLLAESFLKEWQIEVFQAPPFLVSSQIVSSSLIRQCLKDADIQKANDLLGYPYKISGTVISGQRLGRQLGYPTANLSLPMTFLPGDGVYAGLVGFEQKKLKAVLNLGTRPTIDQDKNKKIEIHILDFNKDIYDQDLTFEFQFKIRDELKFADIGELKNQIQKDIDFAVKYWRTLGS